MSIFAEETTNDMETQQIVIYQTEDGQTQIDVRLENETVWLNVSQMSALFNKEESNVRRHILNAFREGELERDKNNVQNLHVNGVKKPVPFYSLDVIISVGYRVKSKRGTAFRIWARKILKDYLVKGYAVNDRIRKEQTKIVPRSHTRGSETSQYPEEEKSTEIARVVASESAGAQTGELAPRGRGTGPWNREG